MNEWRVLRSIYHQGALSRVDVAQAASVTPPTAARAVEALVEAGWLIEDEPRRTGRGRPARLLRVPGRTVHVVGIVVDATGTRLIAGGLDGSLWQETLVQVPPVEDYETLIDLLAESAQELSAVLGTAPMGIGLLIPGLVDDSEGRVVLCPVVPLLTGQTPARDLESRLGQACVLLQEEHALTLAERVRGKARGLEEFVLLNVGMSIGLGAVSGGNLLRGNCGFAGSIGHITVLPDGRECGCGNHGCLEAEAGGQTFLTELTRRKGRVISADESIDLLNAGDSDARYETERLARLVAIGVAAAINLFNPSNLFLHGFLLLHHPPMFDLLVAETRRRTLPPSFARCNIALSGVTKREGAVAGIIEHLMNAHLRDASVCPARHTRHAPALSPHARVA